MYVQCRSEYCTSCYKVGGIQKHCLTPELDDLKQQCIDAREMWKSAGRPRSGELNNIRIRCKFKYESAIKETESDLMVLHLSRDRLARHYVGTSR